MPEAMTVAVAVTAAVIAVMTPERRETDETSDSNKKSKHVSFLLTQQPVPPVQSLFTRDCEEVQRPFPAFTVTLPGAHGDSSRRSR